ncbi:hypothetical protein QF030_004241 [Streptomyces rishiriensis]|uniref:Uncharacterized protein n=1 Tax=Streptomyces rishiriensis TaxID=68264 RepID=A0ABU0NSD2_STRRH|nr:hypothetical protein [Streptomyces rishiriensis]
MPPSTASATTWLLVTMWPWVSKTKPVPVPPSPLLDSASDGDRAGQRLGGDPGDRARVALDVAAVGGRGDGRRAGVVVVLGQRVAESAAQAARDQRGDQDRGDEPAAATARLGRGLLVGGTPHGPARATGAARATDLTGTAGSDVVRARGAVRVRARAVVGVVGRRRGRVGPVVGGGRGPLRGVGGLLRGRRRPVALARGRRSLRRGRRRPVALGRSRGGVTDFRCLRGRRRERSRGRAGVGRGRLRGGRGRFHRHGGCGRGRGYLGALVLALVLGAHSSSPRSTAVVVGRTGSHSSARSSRFRTLLSSTSRAEAVHVLLYVSAFPTGRQSTISGCCGSLAIPYIGHYAQ